MNLGEGMSILGDFQLLKALVKEPENFWSGDGLRQTSKLKRKLDTNWRISENDLDDFVVTLLETSVERIEKGVPIVHLSNIGGAGSHWLGGILMKTGVVGYGSEIYYPNAIKSKDQSAYSSMRIYEAFNNPHSFSRFSK